MNKLLSYDKMTKSYLMETKCQPACLKMGKSLAFSNGGLMDNDHCSATRPTTRASAAAAAVAAAAAALSHNNNCGFDDTEWINEQNFNHVGFLLDTNNDDMMIINTDSPNQHSTGTTFSMMNGNNLVMNPPPTSYANGNSVRPIRRRHFSQQQTGINNNNNNNSNNSNSNGGNSSNSGSGAVDFDENGSINGNNNKSQLFNDELGSDNGINQAHNNNNHNHNHVNIGTTNTNIINNYHHQALKLNTSTGVNNGSSTNTTQSTDKIGKFNENNARTVSSKRSNQQSNNNNGNSSSNYYKQPLVSDYNRDDLNICDSYDNSEKLTNRLAKGIEKVLRLAKENRRLNCTELLVPQSLMSHIADDVIELAECEPCGLRGCLLLICIENNNSNANNNNNNNNNNGLNGHSSIIKQHQPFLNGTSNYHLRHRHQPQHPVSTFSTSSLLGEFAIDSNIVPTFEVFLTLKRVEPSWLETLENKFLKKSPIILSEVYLLNKKKLYQPSSPTF